MEALKQMVIEWVTGRLKEKTTYVGLATLVANALGLGAEYLEPLERLSAAGGSLALIFINTSKKTGTTMKAAPLALLVAVALTLSACAGAVPWNKQNYAGLNEWEIKKCIADTGAEYICKARFIDGKESEAKQLAIQLADGTLIKYSTEGERAFDGFKTRADVEKYVAEQFGVVSTEVVDAIAKQAGIN